MKKAALVVFVLVLAAMALPAVAVSNAPSSVDPPIISWQPPATYTVTAGSGRTALAEIGSGPVPFYPVTPCRQYDSRNTTALPDNTPRTVTLSGAPCGIPSTSNAIAVNITVFSITGAGSNGVFKVDTVSPPVTAWINYPPTETQRGNAGVVATNGTGAIVVQVNQGAGSVQFTVDVFGYYLNTNFTKMPTGDYFPIWGDYAGGATLFGRNDQASAAASYGVGGWSYSTGTGSAGVFGQSLAASGQVYGVSGRVVTSTSSDVAGVYGRDATGLPGNGGVTGHISAGVRGESKSNIGVYGLSNYGGVVGELYNASGTNVASGWLGYLIGPYGVYSYGNTGATGTKSFIEPHPTDASKVVKYVSLEGPEAGTYFRGSGQVVSGTAVIEVPDNFRWVTDESGLTVHITPVGGPGQVWVESRSLDRIVVRSNRDVAFDYIVHGVRRAFRNFQPVVDGNEFMPRSPDEPMPAYLTEEAKKRLIANGTYNPDGTVNMQMAERLGWTAIWAERAKPQDASKASSTPTR